MRKAICFGISRQEDPNLANIYASAEDLDYLTSFLRSGNCDFQTESVLDPTAQELRERLWMFLSHVDIKDQVLVYFTGHGRRNKERRLHLCTVETHIDRLPISSVSFDKVIEIIREHNIRSTLVILDCCYSGAADETLLTKGDDNVFDTHEEKILSDKGLSVLAACSAVETAVAPKGRGVSLFTQSFIDVCKKKAREPVDWIYLPSIYEELRFAIDVQQPRLIGDNNLFPICRGAGKAAKPIRSPVEPTAIEMRPRDHGQATFYGLMVIPCFRAWLLIMDDEHVPDYCDSVGQDVYVRFNEMEANRKRQKAARKYLKTSRRMLERLAKAAASTILLVFPIAIEEQVYDRFYRIERQFILTGMRELEMGTYPVVKDASLFAITQEDSGWRVAKMQESYLKEAFGVVVSEAIDTAGRRNLLIREDTFLRNAKLLTVESYTNLVVDFVSVNDEKKIGDVVFGTAEQLGEEVFSEDTPIRRLPVYDIKYNVRVDTETQKNRRTNSFIASCTNCMDEKFVNVMWGERTYRIPCRVCNASHNQSWRVFNYKN